VTVKTLGHNQDRVQICTFIRNVLIPAKGNAVEDRIDTY